MTPTPTILLLQARLPDDPVRGEERASFAARASLPVESFTTHDLLLGPPTMEQARRHDAVMVGGAGDFYISKRDLPHIEATFDFFNELVETGYPMFASCFGFHCLVESHGGRVINDPMKMEVGTYELQLTDAGRDDPLFGALPATFSAQLGHKDRAHTLPQGVTNLASSEICEFHAFRFGDKPIWTTQFHPELTGDDNRLRFERYMDGYAPLMDNEERSRTRDRFRDSPETDGLIARFLDLVLGWRPSS